MDSEYIREMIQELVNAGAVSDEELARRVLENYWKNQIAMVWTVDDVREALGVYPPISDENAIAVLRRAKADCSAEYGINWQALQDAADELFSF